MWIVGPKPYRPEKGSPGVQYIFVFESSDDVRQLSLELIRIKQDPYSYEFLKNNKVEENIFSNTTQDEIR